MIPKKEYPILYHYRNKNDSDKNLVLTNMQWIPKDQKDDISNKYEKLYSHGKSNGRSIANKFLAEVAKKYKVAPCDPMTVNGFYGQCLDLHKVKVEKKPTSSGTKSTGKYKGPTIAELAAQITHLEDKY